MCTSINWVKIHFKLCTITSSNLRPFVESQIGHLKTCSTEKRKKKEIKALCNVPPACSEQMCCSCTCLCKRGKQTGPCWSNLYSSSLCLVSLMNHILHSGCRHSLGPAFICIPPPALKESWLSTGQGRAQAQTPNENPPSAVYHPTTGS